MTGRFLTGLAAAVLALGLAAPKAHAVVIYDWVGTCDSGCTGQATAVLTLADSYTPGTEADVDDFVSFSYSSSSVSFAVPGDSSLSLFFTGFLPAVSGLAAPAQVDVLSNDRAIITFSSPDVPNSEWDLAFDRFVSPDERFSDIGGDSLWTLRASELSAPGPLSLLALGLAGLVRAGRRRGRAATGGGRCGAALPAGEDRP